MTMLRKGVLIALTTSVFVTSCGKKKSDDESTTTSTATEAITSPSTMMLKINAALSSVPKSSLNTTSLALATSMSGNALCSEHGDPLVDGVTKSAGDSLLESDKMAKTDSRYPSRLFFCLATLSAKDKASVETIQGSLAQVASIFCSFEAAMGSFEYTAAGNSLIATGSTKDVPLSTACWPQGQPDGITSVTMDSATATLLDASTGYEKELKFVSSSADVDYKLRFFNKNGVIGFKTLDAGTSPGVGGYSEMILDSNNGIVLVNTVDDRNGAGGADSAYRRVVRVQVKGEMDTSTLTFKSLTGLQGIRASSSGSGTDLSNFEASTIKGDTTAGFYGQNTMYYNGAFTNSYKGCSGPVTNCTATGLEFTDATFYSSRTEWAAHKESGLPPCYDGKDITFAAVPTTGAFGVCAK